MRSIRASEKSEAMSQTMVLEVTGMDCAACERRLGTVLGRLDGVSGVEADHPSGRVAVRFDPSRVDARALSSTATEWIERAGFTVSGAGAEEVTT